MTTKVAEGVRQEDLFINGKSLPSLAKKTFDDFNCVDHDLKIFHDYIYNK